LQHLIKKLFSFSQTKEASAIEGAVALAKFGHMNRLSKNFTAAGARGFARGDRQNMIKCYAALRIPQAALVQYSKWKTRDFFSREDLKYVRAFLKTSLEKEGFKVEIPELEAMPSLPSRPKKKNEEVSSNIRRVHSAPRWASVRQTMDFDVHFQSANTVTILIPAAQKIWWTAWSQEHGSPISSVTRPLRCSEARVPFPAPHRSNRDPDGGIIRWTSPLMRIDATHGADEEIGLQERLE